MTDEKLRGFIAEGRDSEVYLEDHESKYSGGTITKIYPLELGLKSTLIRFVHETLTEAELEKVLHRYILDTQRISDYLKKYSKEHPPFHIANEAFGINLDLYVHVVEAGDILVKTDEGFAVKGQHALPGKNLEQLRGHNLKRQGYTGQSVIGDVKNQTDISTNLANGIHFEIQDNLINTFTELFNKALKEDSFYQEHPDLVPNISDVSDINMVLYQKPNEQNVYDLYLTDVCESIRSSYDKYLNFIKSNPNPIH